MSVDTDTRDRVIALERDVKHLTAQLDDAIEKLTELHTTFIEWRGGTKTAKFGLRLIWLGFGAVLSAIGFKITDVLSMVHPK